MLFMIEDIRKLYRATKPSNQLKIELRDELNGKRFQNLFVLSLSLEKKLSTAFLLSKVSFLYFKLLSLIS